MPMKQVVFSIVFLIFASLLLDRLCEAATISIPASKDNTIFQNNANNSAGGSPGIFAGTNGNSSSRRGLIAFDLSTANIPPGATITGVQLRLVIAQVAGGGGGGGGGGGFSNPIIELHRLLVDWGEGTAGSSQATVSGADQGFFAGTGDATWNARLYSPITPTAWSTPGGNAGTDYVSAASASLVQGNSVNNVSTWLSTQSLISDVQSWLASPSGNFGWMLINSNETSSQTFRAFYSRSFNTSEANLLPSLQITYTPEPTSMTMLIGGVGAMYFISRRINHARR